MHIASDDLKTCYGTDCGTRPYPQTLPETQNTEAHRFCFNIICTCLGNIKAGEQRPKTQKLLWQLLLDLVSIVRRGVLTFTLVFCAVMKLFWFHVPLYYHDNGFRVFVRDLYVL